MEASTSGPLEIFDPEHENTQLQKTTSTIHPKYDVGATLVTRIRKHLYAALQVSTKDWSQIFDQYDLNGDGEISMKEFRAALRGPSANLSEKILPDNTLRALFNTIDVDNSGGIDSLEFLTWLQEERSEIETGNGETDEISWNVGLSSMALPGVEDSWDLSSPTSPRPKRSPPLTPSSSFIKPIRGYKQPDFLSKSASPHSKRFQQVENMKSKPPQDEFLRNKLRAAAYDFGGINFRKLFRHQDRDNSGSLSYDEFKRAIRKDGKMSNSILSDHDLNTLFHQIDIDNGGEIEIDEFIRWLKKPGDKVIDRSGENIRKTNEKKRQQHSAGMVNQPHENVNQQLDLPHEQRLLPPPKWDYYSPPPPLPPPPAHDFLAAPISPRSPPMALKVGGHHALLLQNVDNMLNEINLYEKKGVTFRKSRQSPTNLIKHKRPPSSLVNMTPRQERRLAAALDHMGVFSRSGAEDLFQMLNKYANSRDLIDHYGFSLSLRSNFNKQHAKTSTATLKNRTIDSLWFLLDSKRSGKINVVEFQQWMWNRLQKNITYGTESSHVKIKKKSQSKKKNSIQQMYEEQRNVRAASPSKHLNRRPNWRWCESPSSPCNAETVPKEYIVKHRLLAKTHTSSTKSPEVQQKECLKEEEEKNTYHLTEREKHLGEVHFCDEDLIKNNGQKPSMYTLHELAYAKRFEIKPQNNTQPSLSPPPPRSAVPLSPTSNKPSTNSPIFSLQKPIRSPPPAPDDLLLERSKNGWWKGNAPDLNQVLKGSNPSVNSTTRSTNPLSTSIGKQTNQSKNGDESILPRSLLNELYRVFILSKSVSLATEEKKLLQYQPHIVKVSNYLDLLLDDKKIRELMHQPTNVYKNNRFVLLHELLAVLMRQIDIVADNTMKWQEFLSSLENAATEIQLNG